MRDSPCAPVCPRSSLTKIRMHPMHLKSRSPGPALWPGATFATRRSARRRRCLPNYLPIRSHSRGQLRTRMTNRQPQGPPTTQADCRWHGRSQIAESGPNLGPTPAIGHHGTLLAIGAAAISTLAADAQNDPRRSGGRGVASSNPARPTNTLHAIRPSRTGIQLTFLSPR